MSVLRSRIFWKLAATYLALVAAILLVVDFYIGSVFTRKDFNPALRDHLRTLATVLVQEVPDLADARALSLWANAASQRLSGRVSVVNAEGSVLADSERNPDTTEDLGLRDEIREALTGKIGMKMQYSRTAKKDFAFVTAPIRSNAVLRLALPLTESSAEINQVRSRIVFISIIALAIAAGIAYVISRSLSRRIKQIVNFSEKIAAGNLSERIKFIEKDEIGKLGQSLNLTADKLHGTIEQLIRERNKIEVVLSSMVEGLLAVDQGKRIILVNPALSRIFGFEPKAIIGRTILEAIRNNDLHELMDQVLRLGEEIRKFTSISYPEEKTFEVHAVPLFSDQAAGPSAKEKTIGAVAVLHDITELKRLEVIRRDLVANVSHELRTPLAAIKGYAETLLDGALGDADNRRHFVEGIHNNADRLARITEDLLTLSSMETQGFRLKSGRFPMSEAIENVLPLIKEQAAKKKQTLEINVPSDLPSVQADPERIDQVLLNLLDNAIKFTPEGGRIVVGGRKLPDSEMVEISINDTGSGIPPRDLPRIFERFYRVDKARSRALGGTGLGLAIVKHIVESHGGKVWAESTFGRGSTFKFTLPPAP